MNRTSRILTGRASRVRRELGEPESRERLAIAKRRLDELQWQQQHLLDHGDTVGALDRDLLREIDALRHEVAIRSAAKFGTRPKPKTIAFRRDPVRVMRSIESLDQHAKQPSTAEGYSWFLALVVKKWNDALDDLLRVGRRKNDIKVHRDGSLLSNRHRRVS